jgi:hypothetical protein
MISILNADIQQSILSIDLIKKYKNESIDGVNNIITENGKIIKIIIGMNKTFINGVSKLILKLVFIIIGMVDKKATKDIINVFEI